MNHNPLEENRFLYAVRAIACMFVIFIHYRLPGLPGDLVRALARFAVPVFFAIAGRFLPVEGTMRRRIEKLLKTTLIVWGVYTVYSLILHLTGHVYIDPYYGEMRGTGDIFRFWLTDKFNPHELLYFFLFNSSKVIYDVTYTFDHLWFLFALLYVYVLYALFSRFVNRWYGVIGTLTMGLMFFGEILQTVYPIRPFGININDWYVLRNWLFTGIPFTCLGLYFRDRASGKVKSASSPLPVRVSVMLLMAGIFSTMIEFHLFGAKEVTFGSLLIVISLLFLSEADIPVPDGPVSFGRLWSGPVYYWHILILSILNHGGIL